MNRIVNAAGILINVSIIIFLSSCTHDTIDSVAALDYNLTESIKKSSLTGETAYYILPSETDYSAIPQDVKNPLTKEKVELGKFLFFETGFGLDSRFESGIETYSCASCHIPEKGFRPDNVQGIADGGIGYAEDRDAICIYHANSISILTL